MEHNRLHFFTFNHLENIVNKYRSDYPQATQPPNKHFCFFSTGPISHISAERETKLPGVPLCPPPLLFPLVSPDLSTSVSKPSLCLTDGQSLSRQSLRRLSETLSASRQGPFLPQTPKQQMKKGPMLPNRGDAGEYHVFRLGPPFLVWSLACVAKQGLRIKENFDL